MIIENQDINVFNTLKKLMFEGQEPLVLRLPEEFSNEFNQTVVKKLETLSNQGGSNLNFISLLYNEIAKLEGGSNKLTLNYFKIYDSCTSEVQKGQLAQNVQNLFKTIG